MIQNSRLVELCLSFGPYKVRELRKFLRSPYFNQREDVRQLFELIIKTEGELADEDAFMDLYPNEKYDAQQLRFVMSWLVKRLEKYLLVEDLLADKSECQVRLCQLYRQQDLDRHATASQRQSEKLLAKTSFHSSSFYQQRHRLVQEQNLLASKQRRTAVLHLQEQSDSLDMYFLVTKLKEACELLSHQAVVKSSYDLSVLEALLPFVTPELLEKQPVLGIFLECFQMLQAGTDATHFFKLKAKLQEAGHLLPLDERRDVYLFAINFSIRRYNASETNFGEEAFLLYQLALAEGLLTLDGYLSRFAYRNIVALGLQLKRFDWVAAFLEEYRPRLAPSYQSATYFFNLAKLEYARGNLDAVIVALQKADYRDVLLNLAAKTLLVKVYYEQQELLALDSHLSAMRRFLRRKKMLAYHRDNYLHFVRAMKKLIGLNFYDREAVRQMKKELAVTQPLTEKEWLLAQLRTAR